MFRDLKEYQEIAKIYADKVSKPEDLDENRNTRGQALRMQREKNKPKTREELGLPPKKKPSPFERKFGKERNEKRMISQGVKKPIPSTAEIRKANPNVVPGTRVNEVGAKGGGKPSEGDFKKDFPDKKPEVSKFTKQGKPRTKAQMMAAKRIADGKSISDVKAANTASMKAKASERNQKFQDAKKSGNLAQFRKDNPKMSGADRAKAMAKARLAKKAAMENYTPYDIVLEYLLSSEQVATIEEANYVMTEMDAETIQGIVEMDMMKMPVVNVLGGLSAAGGAVKGIASYLGRKAGERGIKKEGEKPGKPGLVKTIKDRTDATNKAIEKM